MNCSRLYTDQSFATGSVISNARICVKSPWIGAFADSTAYPVLSRPNTWTQRERRSSMWSQSQLGIMTGIMSTGMRICGDWTGSRPAKPSSDTPTIVIG